jgi:divalent metal cation (Fe/Co/Zn/Cd) transporter
LTNEQEKWVVDIMLSVTVVKLALALYCRSFTNEIVKAYAQDHMFDVMTNIIGLVAALLANYFEGWIDPVGAIIVSDDCLGSSILSSFFFFMAIAFLFHLYKKSHPSTDQIHKLPFFKNNNQIT